MTATDELRRLLDERGAKWMPIAWNPKRETFYHTSNGVGFCADEYADGVKIYTDATITPEQAVEATLGDADATGERQRDAVEVVRCRDCVHGHITINGESCKWCDLIATHDIDGNEPNNGYDPEPYFDADFFCAWAEKRED